MSANIKWDVETTIKFIQLYKLHPCLWNFKSPEYKIKQKRDAAYNSIVQEMNITGFGTQEVKNKIKNLRSTYQQENKKIQDSKKSGAGLSNVYTSNIKWLKEMEEVFSNDLNKNVYENKLVVDRLRRELELYQQRLKARNNRVNFEYDNRYIAKQLRDHQIQYRNRNRVSLLKPSVLNELHIKSENHNDDMKENISDSENEIRLCNDKENSNHSDSNEKDRYQANFSQLPNTVHNSRNNFANALNKVKESLIATKFRENNEWQEQDSNQYQGHEQRSDSESSRVEPSPTPSPPPLPDPGEPVTQETFMRLIGLLTPAQKEILEKKRNERRKRATTSTNRNDFLYGNFDMMPKKKKYNNFPYLQTNNDPPQTRSAKLKKQNQHKSSREGSPSGSSSENKGGWGNNKPSWVAALPVGLSVEPVCSPTKKICIGCGRNDVPSLLVWCASCCSWQHTGCGAEGRCASCRARLPEPDCAPDHVSDHHHHHLYRDKLAERKRLQEKNIQLCVELRKLEVRAASLKENLDEHNAEKRQLLADQIKTQRDLHKLLDFIGQFKDTAISMRSTSVSESGSEISKSNEE